MYFCTNPEYIHEFDMMIGYEEVLESVDDSVNSAIANLIKVERKVKYSAMFENADNMYMIEEAKKNLFERIGDGIKQLLTKLANMIKKIFGKSNEDELKKNVATVQQAVAKNPSLKDEILEGIKDGKYDVKDLPAYLKAYDEASKLLAEGKIDPETFKGKMELAKKKFDEKPKTVIRLQNVNALLALITGGALFKIFADARKNHGETSSAIDRARNRFHKTLATKDGEGKYNTGLAAFWEATRELINANANEMNKNSKILNILNNIGRKFSKKSEESRSKEASGHLEKSHVGDITRETVLEARKNLKISMSRLNRCINRFSPDNPEGERIRKITVDKYLAVVLAHYDIIIEKDKDLTELEKAHLIGESKALSENVKRIEQKHDLLMSSLGKSNFAKSKVDKLKRELDSMDTKDRKYRSKKDEYDKLKDEYDKLKDEYDKLKDEYDRMIKKK